jgi:hypothetical protein
MNHPIEIALREWIYMMRDAVHACRPAAHRAHRGKARNGDEQAARRTISQERRQQAQRESATGISSSGRASRRESARHGKGKTLQ